MAEAKKIYLYDKENGNALKYARFLETGEPLPEDATEVVCPNGLYDPCFDEAAQSWKGITREEWEAKHPADPAKPNITVQTMNTMGLQIASLTKQNHELSQTVNTLGLQIAKMQDTKTTNGGN